MAVSEYYSRVTMERLASLLGLPIGQMEEELSAMVSKKQARTCPCSRPCPALKRLPLPIFTRFLNLFSRAAVRSDRSTGGHHQLRAAKVAERAAQRMVIRYRRAITPSIHS